MQVALVVTADELAVLGERNVALDDARALTRAGGVRLFGVFRQQQRRAAMRDRELGAANEIIRAAQQFALEFALVHAIDEPQRAFAHLDGWIATLVVPTRSAALIAFAVVAVVVLTFMAVVAGVTQ